MLLPWDYSMHFFRFYSKILKNFAYNKSDKKSQDLFGAHKAYKKRQENLEV